MSDRAALLRAIIAHPDEDTPRLVYADWLDENGNTNRAACIRAQIERERVAESDTATATVCAHLKRESDPGLDRVAWPGEVGAEVAARRDAKRRFKLSARGEGVPRVAGVRFCDDVRGFFDGLSVWDTAAFLRHADAVFRAAPVTSIVLGSLNEEQAVEFAASPHFAQIRELYLERVEPGAIEVLGRAKAAAGVRELWLDPAPAGGALFEALARGTWGGLEKLNACNFDDEADAPTEEQVVATLTRPPFRNLRALALWGDTLGNDAAQVFAGRLPELRYLDLTLNRITGAGGAALAASKSLRHLRHLELGSCDMEDGETAMAALINTKNLPNLAVLDLGGNFADLNARVLARPGRGPTLRVLRLDSTRPTPAGLEALAKCPAVRGVWRLKLGAARLSDDHFERFLAHATFEQLTALDLHRNDLGPRSAKALAAWPGATSLQWLDLSGNPVGDSGARAFAASPHLSGLKYLNFTGRGTATLKKRFKKVFAGE